MSDRESVRAAALMKALARNRGEIDAETLRRMLKELVVAGAAGGLAAGAGRL